MQAVTDCPSLDMLQRYLSGRTTESDAGVIERHVEQCPRCLAALEPIHQAARAAEPCPLNDDDLAQPPEWLLRRLQSLTDSRSFPPTFHPAPSVQAPEVRSGALPASFGRYQVHGFLGEGGMAVVYKSLDPDLGRPVAVKVPIFKGSDEAKALARTLFLREARAAAKVRHPNVCAIHDVGDQDGNPYVVMDLIPGGTLARRVQEKGPFKDGRIAVRLVQQVAEALAAVHAAGILHRDLKPGNILLDEADRPYLADFGLARISDEGESLTPSGALVGTPAYMAPEQVSPEFGLVTARSDVYSLGVTLYQLITGTLPFTGATISEVLYQVTRVPVTPPSRLRVDLDPDLEAIILQAMARDPAARFETAEVFAAALAEWLEHALPPLEDGEIPTDPVLKGRRPATNGGTRGSARRRQSIYAVATGLFVLSLLGGWLIGLAKKTGEQGSRDEANLSLLTVRVWKPDRNEASLAETVPLENDDKLRIRWLMPAGLHAALCVVNGEGRLSIEKEYPPLSVPTEIVFPGPGSVSPLKGPTGTELIFVCGRAEGPVIEDDVRAAWDGGRPWPALPARAIYRLSLNRVVSEGELPRDLGPPEVEPHEIVRQRLDGFRERLAKSCSFCEGLAFRHGDAGVRR